MSCTLDYPRDNLRYDFFVKESNQHQAKMELRTFVWCVLQYTEPGDTILDPMSGVGTIHLANFMGRNTVAVELMPEFVVLQDSNLFNMAVIWRNDAGKFGQLGIPFEQMAVTDDEVGSHTIFEGDCRRHLPLENPVSAVIFSPPYGSLWTHSDAQKQSKINVEKNYQVGYGESDANVGNYKTYPHYLKAMEIIYGKCLDSLKPGGIMVTVVKDYIHQGRRVLCSRDNLRMCLKAGFEMEDWHFRSAGMQNNPFSAGNRAKRIAAGKHKPELDIDREDIIVVRKPSG